MWPINGARDITVLYRIDVDVIYVRFKIAVVTDRMFPKPLLP